MSDFQQECEKTVTSVEARWDPATKKLRYYAGASGMYTWVEITGEDYARLATPLAYENLVETLRNLFGDPPR